jgi:predicted small secreted protein
MLKTTRLLLLFIVMFASVILSGCNANIGVGMSVGVPIGNYGHMSIGLGRGGWY